MLGLTAPVVGIVLAAKMAVLADLWALLSLVITAAAGVVLAAIVLPTQRGLMAAITGVNERWSATGGSGLLRAARRLSMFSGIFALLWLVVVVPMIVRPGWTTGV
jgi:hypothetical protein